MSFSQLLILQNQGTLFLFKFGFITVLALLGIFLLVVLSQIRAMNRIVTQPDLFPYLQGVVILLEIITVLLILAALVIL